ncbi:hypothetical protein D3C73_1198680 [compost metagenome]
MQQRAGPRGQFSQRKGLDQVVVRARIETRQAIVQGVARGHHDDRRVARGLGTQAAAQFVAVQARQHQVQHDQVKAARRRHRVTA